MPVSRATQPPAAPHNDGTVELRSERVPPPGVRAKHGCTPLGAEPSVHATLEGGSTALVVRQTWKERKLPFWVASHRRHLIALNPSYRFEIWDDRDCEHFMRTVAEPWIRWAYFTINPSVGAARADIWRYAVLHRCGGVYFDLDSTLIGSLREWLDHSTAVVSCEANTVSEYDLNMARRLNISTDGLVGGKCVRAQWFLASPARHPVMLKVMEVVAENIARYQNVNGFGMSMHTKATFVTGPMAWTRAVNIVKGQRHPGRPLREYAADFGGHARFSFAVPSNVTRHSADALHGYNRLRWEVDLKVTASMVVPRLPVLKPTLQPQRASSKRQRHLPTGGGHYIEPRTKRSAATTLLRPELPPLPFWVGAAVASACVCACACGRVCVRGTVGAVKIRRHITI